MNVGILIPLQKDPYSAIAQAAELGFSSGQVSVWNMDLYNPETEKQLREACREYGFTVTALWCGWSGPVDWSYPNMYQTLGLVPAAWRSQRTADLLAGAAFAHNLGIRDVVTHLGYLPDDPFHPDRMGVVQAVRYLCGVIGRRGQRLLIETGEDLPNTLVQFIKETVADNIGLNFDPANLLINGRANPADALCMLAPWVMGCHGKDGIYPRNGNPKGKEVQVGHGQADFPRLVGILKSIGYTGDITIEHERHDSGHRLAEIKAAKEYLSGLIDGEGT